MSVDSFHKDTDLIHVRIIREGTVLFSHFKFLLVISYDFIELWYQDAILHIIAVPYTVQKSKILWRAMRPDLRFL